ELGLLPRLSRRQLRLGGRGWRGRSDGARAPARSSAGPIRGRAGDDRTRAERTGGGAQLTTPRPTGDQFMSNIDPTLERNRAFAEAGSHEGAMVFPALRLFVITCLD